MLDYLEGPEGELAELFNKLRGDRCIATVRQRLLADEITCVDVAELNGRVRVGHETSQHAAREVELQEGIMVGVILLEDFEDEISKDGAVGDVGVPVEETASGDPSGDEFERDHLDIARPEGDWVELLDEMGGHTIGVQ